MVLSFDGSGTPQQGSRIDALVQYEQCLGADSCELYHIDYSYKAVKPVVAAEQQAIKEAQERVTIPVHYGSQPDLGRYSSRTGRTELVRAAASAAIDEARAAQEEAVELAVEDMVHVAESMWEAGADGINFDTAGAAGDGDLLAALLAVERLRAAHPDMGIMVGMAAERSWACTASSSTAGRGSPGCGLRVSARSSQQAGATIFGPAVNVNTGAAWPGTSRGPSRMKPCCESRRIPVHINVGMGVGGHADEYLPPRRRRVAVSQACVDILRLDGL